MCVCVCERLSWPVLFVLPVCTFQESADLRTSTLRPFTSNRAAYNTHVATKANLSAAELSNQALDLLDQCGIVSVGALDVNAGGAESQEGYGHYLRETRQQLGVSGVDGTSNEVAAASKQHGDDGTEAEAEAAVDVDDDDDDDDESSGEL